MQYRPDIDGLRAIAVVSVVLCHAHVPGFTGGYVGVDVFFVISGYLITTLIDNDLKAGRFCLFDFYERRVRRIIPALTLVITATLMMGLLLHMPQDYRLLVRSAFAVTVFASNMLFWRDVGYFDAVAAEKPLLHTWSLSVEEQFYVLFPAFMVLTAASSVRKKLALITLLLAASFASTICVLKFSQSSSFYFSPLRAWEILAGSLVALTVWRPALSLAQQHVLQLVALSAIVLPVALYDESTAFPGLAALSPVAGAALLIFAGLGGGDGGVKRLLGSAPLVFVGKVSYSFYLWHFPLLAFATYAVMGRLAVEEGLAIVAVAFGVAVLSYRYVETPFRDRQRIGRLPIFAGSGLASLAVATFSLSVYLVDGWPSRFKGGNASMAVTLRDDYNQDRYSCFFRSRVTDGCKLGAPKLIPRFVLWGDSHAEVLRTGLDAIARRKGLAGVYLGGDGCPPIARLERPGNNRCLQTNQQILTSILNAPHVDTVILAARWPMWLSGRRYGHEIRGPVDVRVEGGAWPANEVEQESVVTSALVDTIEQLDAKGKTVWVVGPVPEIGFDVPQSIFLSTVLGTTQYPSGIPLQRYMQRSSSSISMLSKIEKAGIAHIVYPHARLCNGDTCRFMVDLVGLYHDDDHLSRSGSLYIASLLSPTLSTIITQAH